MDNCFYNTGICEGNCGMPAFLRRKLGAGNTAENRRSDLFLATDTDDQQHTGSEY